MTPDTPTPAEPLSDSEYLLAMIDDQTFAGVPEIRRHHERIISIAAKLAEIAQPATPEPLALLAGWTFKRDGDLIIINSPTGDGVVVLKDDEAPRVLPGVVLFELAETILATQPATHVALTDDQIDALMPVPNIAKGEDLPSQDGGGCWADLWDSAQVREVVRAALATQAAFSSSNTSNTLGVPAQAPSGSVVASLPSIPSIPDARTPTQER